VAFREREVRTLASSLKRTRQRKAKARPSGGRAGRPNRQAKVAPVLEKIIEAGKWSPIGSLKDLTKKVNRLGNFLPPVSEDTATRALDQLYQETGDRRFERIARRHHGSKALKKMKAHKK
jgi:hypothetical protein